MRKSTVMLTVALIGSVAMSAWLWTELRAERARNAELSARENPPPTLVPVPVSATTPKPTTSLPATPTASATASPRVVQATQEDEVAYQRRMLQQPKYREAWRQQQRLNYAPRRENLIRLLGLSPEQADAVIDIDIDRELGWIENLPGTQELQDADERDHQAKLGALLGEEKRAQLQAYMESRSTRMQIDQFRPKFTGADALRDDQVEPLIAALHVERAQMQKELEEYRVTLNPDDAESWMQYGERRIGLMKAAYDRMHAAAAPVLSSSQIKRLDALLKHDLERQEAQQRMQQVEAKLNSSSAGASSAN
jgi:hypothetical protein